MNSARRRAAITADNYVVNRNDRPTTPTEWERLARFTGLSVADLKEELGLNEQA